MRRRKKNNILIGVLFCSLVFMGIGYAALSQVLNITSTANVTGDFNIIIDNIKDVPERSHGAESVKAESQKDTSASFEAVFHKPGEFISYDVTVKNQGSIKGVLKKIVVTQEVSEDVENPMQAILDEKGLTIDDIFETKIFEIDKDTQEAIELNSEGLNKQLDVDESYNFDIRTTLKDIDFIPLGTMTTKVNLVYDQIGAPTLIDTTGESGETVESVDNSDIEVNDEGLLTKINIEKHTDENGYLVLPATASNGNPITSIGKNSFTKYNVADVYDYNEETGEELYYFVIYDEEHFDEIKQIVLRMMEEAYPGEDMSETPFYKASEKELSPTADIIGLYADLETGICDMALNAVEKIDLTGATDLTTIMDETFYQSLLSDIRFGESVTTIGDYAFSTTQLNEIDLELPDSLEYIGHGAFSGSGITGLTIPSSVTQIESYAFSNNAISKLTNLSSTTTIEYGTFSFNQISTLTIPSSVTKIGGDAFSNNQINILKVPSNVTQIEYNAFSHNQINELIVPISVTEIGQNAFSFQNHDDASGKYLGINKVTIGKHFQSMFEPAVQISELSIDSGNINANTFSNAGITKLTLGDGVSSVGIRSFANNKINDLTILSDNISVGNYAFANQGYDASSGKYLGINKVEIEKYNTTFEYAFTNGNTTDKPKIFDLTIKSGTIDKPMKFVKITELTLTGGVVAIGDNAFKSTLMNKLTLEEGVTTIGSNAFSNNSLSTLTIPDSVTSIGKSAFEYNVIIDLIFNDTSGLITIGDEAFARNQVTKLTLPSSVKSIGTRSFGWNQIAKPSFAVPSSLEEIGSGAFNYNQMDGELDLTNLTTLSNLDGFDNNQITSVKFPINLESIEQNAFYNNQITGELDLTNLTQLTSLDGFSMNAITGLKIPANVTDICAGAFSYNKISELTIPSTVTAIGTNAFVGQNFQDKISPGISKVVIEKYVAETYRYSMFGSKLEVSELIIESGDIDGYAFSGGKIKKLTIGSGVTSIGDHAFYDNPLTLISIQRTEQDFNANVTIGGTWYSGTPTITYQS